MNFSVLVTSWKGSRYAQFEKVRSQPRAKIPTDFLNGLIQFVQKAGYPRNFAGVFSSKATVREFLIFGHPPAWNFYPSKKFYFRDVMPLKLSQKAFFYTDVVS